ncbi:hypothetical protein B0H34DRAFT_639066, partial [Crassisporium funariophilum]
ICRLGCNETESPRHLFVECKQYQQWRIDATQEVLEKTELKTDTIGIAGIAKENLLTAAKSLFKDDPTVWPLQHSHYFLGQIPNIKNLINDNSISTIQKQCIKSHISSDWHTTSIQLVGRIFGDFQKRMAVLND